MDQLVHGWNKLVGSQKAHQLEVAHSATSAIELLGEEAPGVVKTDRAQGTVVITVSPETVAKWLGATSAILADMVPFVALVALLKSMMEMAAIKFVKAIK